MCGENIKNDTFVIEMLKVVNTSSSSIAKCYLNCYFAEQDIFLCGDLPLFNQ